MKKISLLTLLVILVNTFAVFSQTARVQVIHNSADAAASVVDVYLDTTLLIDDFAFRTASPFIDAPAGSPITIGIAGGNSNSVADTIASFALTLMSNETYVVTANGIVSSLGYSPSPAFGLDIFAMGRESASTAGNTDIQIVHGSTDAPTVDVVAVGVGTIADNLMYNSYLNDYLEVATADLTLEIYDENQTTLVATFSAPLSTLGLQDSALVVVASGFLDPTQNSNGDPFGLFVALPSGGSLVALPVITGLENNIASAFKMFPNPVEGNLNIDLELFNKGVVDVRVFDFIGREVYVNEFDLEAGFQNLSLELSDLTAGTYKIQLGQGVSAIKEKFIKL